MGQSPNLRKISSYGLDNAAAVTTLVTGATTYQMKDHERLLHVTVTNSGYVNLPPVALCAGEIVCVEVVSVAGGQTASVRPYIDASSNKECIIVDEDGEGGSSSVYALASAAAYLLLYSTGRRWIQLNFDLSV